MERQNVDRLTPFEKGYAQGRIRAKLNSICGLLEQEILSYTDIANALEVDEQLVTAIHKQILQGGERTTFS